MWLGPLESVAVRRPWPLFVAILAAVLILGSPALGSIQRKLRTAATPKQPILDWEKAATEARMDEILQAWGPSGRRWAAISLAVDTLFLIAYGAALTLACSMAAAFYRWADGSVGEAFFGFFAWLAVAVAVLDAVENALLLRMLGRFEGDAFPRAMARVSKTKWQLVFVVVPVALVAVLIALLGSGSDWGGVRR